MRTQRNASRTSLLNLNPRNVLAVVLGLGTSAGFLLLSALSGCGEPESAVRRGEKGANCLTTNDCAAPLSCIQNICGGPSENPPDAGDAGANEDASGIDAPVPDGAPWSECDDCLDKKCVVELAACDSECIAVEACIEMVCQNIGQVDPAEESKCFVQCQTQHPSGKDPHLAVVDCADKAVCTICQAYPTEYNNCRAFVDQGQCAPYLSACDNSPACQTYRDCVKGCSTLADCNLCDNTADGIAGKKILFDYEMCVAAECISESWNIN